MQQNNNEITFTEKENKLISAAFYAFNSAVLFQSIIIMLINTDKIGRICFFSYIAAFILFAFSALFYLALFITGLRKIKPYLNKYIAAAVLFVLLLPMHCYLAADHFADAFKGSTIITAAEYNLTIDNKLVLFDGSREIGLDIPEDTASQLDELERSHKSELSLSERYLLIHPNTITVEYYENTEVFLSVEINE